MKKTDLFKYTKVLKKTVAKRSPELLIILGAGGLITAGILAVKETPKALRLIESEVTQINEELYQMSQENDICEEYCKIEKLDTVKVIRTCWKCYAPSVILAILSTGCLIGSNRVTAKRTAALATAYQLSSTALSEYREKVIETIGEKKEKEVRNKVAEEQVKKNPVKDQTIIITGDGDSLCLDTTSGQYFKSNAEKIKRVENQLNSRLFNHNYVSLNELYYELGLRETTLGDELGWNVDNGMLELYLSATLTEDEQPCIVLNYETAPKYEYNRVVR